MISFSSDLNGMHPEKPCAEGNVSIPDHEEKLGLVVYRKSERERPARSCLRSVVLWHLSVSTVLGHSLPPFGPLSKIRIICGTGNNRLLSAGGAQPQLSSFMESLV